VRLLKAHVWGGLSQNVFIPVVTGRTVWAELPFRENKRAICK
jgi:hypothetical protein